MKKQVLPTDTTGNWGRGPVVDAALDQARQAGS